MNLKNCGASHGQRQPALGELLVARLDDRVQQHHAVGRQRGVGHLEEVVVAVAAEVLERADRDDPVDRLVELLPALQQYALGARAVRCGEHASATWAFWFWLSVRPMTLTSYFSSARVHRRAPAAADVEQRHAGLQAELAQRQVDLGDLGLFERHVVALEVRTAVGLRADPERAGRIRRTGRSATARPRSAASSPGCRSWFLAR